MVKNIIFNIYFYFKFKKKKYPTSPNRILKYLLKSQYYLAEEIQRYQLERINKLVFEAKNYSKYYNNSYKPLKSPLKSLNEFQNTVPAINKSDIIENSKSLRSKNFTTKYQHATSGSSGDPVTVYTSALAEVYRKAGHLRFKEWWGIKPLDKSVLIWRYENSVGTNIIKRFKKIFKSRYDINVYNLNDKNINKHFDFIEKFKPTYIRGYTSGILEFAKLLYKHNLEFKRAKFKVVIVTAENLFDHDRKFIESVLKCKVANEFGSAESGYIAYECPQGCLHIYEEAIFVYQDENSFAYITELYNDSMPLINYKNDDKIKISTNHCKCGRTSRVIESLMGRESGYIMRSDGTKLNQGILIAIFIGLQEEEFGKEAIKKFKVIQRDKNFDVFIVPLSNYNVQVENYIKNQMSLVIGNDINISIYLKDQIEREKSGKLRYFIREEK